MAFSKRRSKEGRGQAPRTKPGKSAPARSAHAATARRAISAMATTARRMAIELYRIAVELLRLPAALYMRAAERAGAFVLAGWLVVWPLVRSGWRAARRAIAVAERQVTPARATLVVGAAAAVALGASQFADYRSVTIGTSAYLEVEGVAPPPEVNTASTGSAHAWAGLPLAAFALVILAACALGRWRSARLLIPIGAAVVAISLFVDRPKGLDEGEAAVTYDGASATLLGGFWAQLVSGLLLIAVAPLLTRLLDPRASATSAPRWLSRLPGPSLRRRRPATGESR